MAASVWSRAYCDTAAAPVDVTVLQGTIAAAVILCE